MTPPEVQLGKLKAKLWLTEKHLEDAETLDYEALSERQKRALELLDPLHAGFQCSDNGELLKCPILPTGEAEIKLEDCVKMLREADAWPCPKK